MAVRQPKPGFSSYWLSVGTATYWCSHVGCKQMYLQTPQLGPRLVVWSVETFDVNTKLNLFCESAVGASNWMLFWCGYCQFYWPLFILFPSSASENAGITSSPGQPLDNWRNTANSQLPCWDPANVHSPECLCQVCLPWKYILVHWNALKSVFVDWSEVARLTRHTCTP